MAELSPAVGTIAVLISGRGSTLQNLIQLRQRGRWPVEIRGVISSSGQAGGLEIARDAGIEAQVVAPQAPADVTDFSRRIFEQCREWKVDYVVMGGFLKRVSIPPDFALRVVNVHPSLIPAFCGKSYYGMRVHQAVIDYGCKVSGCTVHFVDDQYDHGPVIAQRCLSVRPTDTAESLAQRVICLERRLYPAVIAALVKGEIQCQGRRVWRTRRTEQRG